MILHDVSGSLPFDLSGLAYRRARFDPAFVSQLLQMQRIDASAPDMILRLPPALQAAIPRRQTEFLAGRACAALALHAAGSPMLTVDFNPDRSPAWPPGFVGSISHSAAQVCAIVAPSRRYAMLGLDLEYWMDEGQALEIAGLILTDAEADLRPPMMPRAQFLTLVFSAKEALYKAIFPKLHRIIEFHDVTLTALNPSAAQLRLTIPHPDLPKDFRVHIQISPDTCLTLVAV